MSVGGLSGARGDLALDAGPKSGIFNLRWVFEEAAFREVVASTLRSVAEREGALGVWLGAVSAKVSGLAAVDAEQLALTRVGGSKYW